MNTHNQAQVESQVALNIAVELNEGRKLLARAKYEGARRYVRSALKILTSRENELTSDRYRELFRNIARFDVKVKLAEVRANKEV